MKLASFEGQHALISGGGSGIGRALALALAAQGAAVRIVDRDRSKLVEVASHHPASIRWHECDLRDAAQWAAIAADGPCDILINNAAVSLRTDLLNPADTSLADVMGVNFGGAWTSCRAAAPRMIERGGGRIVNISSVHSRLAERGSSAYGVAKAALEQFTRCLAIEWAKHGILVNAVAPGFVDTPMSRKNGVSELETDWFRNEYVGSGRLPLGRAAQPEEIAPPVLFLASRQNTYVTGHVLIVDGGLSLTL